MMSVIVGALAWTFVGPQGGDVVSVSAEGTVVMAGAVGVAYRSSDEGLSWNRVQGVSGHEPVPGFIPSMRTVVLGGRSFVFHSNGFLYSDDGVTWSSEDYPGVSYVSDPAGGTFLFVAGNTLYIMDNTYNPVALLSLPSDSTIEAAASLDTLWYAFVGVGDSLKVYKGGASSYSVVGTIPYVDINDVAINPDNPDEVILATSGSGLMVSGDGGATFAPDYGSIAVGAVVLLDVDYINADSIRVASFYYPGIYDGGRGIYGWTLDAIYTDSDVMAVDGDFAAAFGKGILYIPSMEYRNEGLYAHTIYVPALVSNSTGDRLTFMNMGGQPFYTTDGGTTWNEVPFKMDIGTSIEVAPYDEDIILIGGHKASGNIMDPRSTVLVRSTDGGATFTTLIDTPISQLSSFPYEIQAGSDPSSVFMVLGRPGYWDMMFSSDTGTSFSVVMHNGGYNGFCFSCVDTLFIITDTGDVYMSLDAGASWNYILNIGYPGNVYLTYWDGFLYYANGHDSYLRVIDPQNATLDSMDLSAYFDSVMTVQASHGGYLFLTGYSAGQFRVAYGASPDNLVLDDAPSGFGGLIPLISYVFFYSPNDGGFYVSPYPVSVRESVSSRVKYTSWGILLEGVNGPVYVYDIRGGLVRIVKDNRIYRKSLNPGLYILKTAEGTYRIILR